MDKKARSIYMLPTRDPPQIKRHTQTKSKEMEKRYFMYIERGKKR